MKMLTLIAFVPPHDNKEFMRKLWSITSYLKNEVGIKVNLVVLGTNEEPRIIAMDEVISLYRDIEEIVMRITSKLSYDVADKEFLSKVAAGITTKS